MTVTRAISIAALLSGAAAGTFGSYAWTHAIDRDRHVVYSQEIGFAIAADQRLDQELLRASYGLSQDFDGIDAGTRDLDSGISRLDSVPAYLDEDGKGELDELLHGDEMILAALARKHVRVERFKSELARVRSLIFYYPIVAGELSENVRRKYPDLSTNLDQITRDLIFYLSSRDFSIAERIEKLELSSLAESESAYPGEIGRRLHDSNTIGLALMDRKPHLDGLFETILSKSYLSSAGKPSDAMLLVFAGAYQEAYERALLRDAGRNTVVFLLVLLTVALGAGWIIVTIRGQRELIRAEHNRAESLLLNILPGAIATQLKSKPNEIIAENYRDVTVLFADIVGFTPLASKLSPVDLVRFLNEIFSGFDRLAEKYGLEKIKTLGDAYMVAGGLPDLRPDHAVAVANMALEMQQQILAFRGKAGEGFGMRIGMNSGPVVAGVIGIKKFIYDLWGDAVNVASRMESHGVANGIHCSDATYQQLKDKGFRFESRGRIQIKGKGEMQTWLLLGREEKPAN